MVTSIDPVASLSSQNLVRNLEPLPQLSEQLPQSDHDDQSMITFSEGAEDACIVNTWLCYVLQSLATPDKALTTGYTLCVPAAHC